MVYLLQSLLKYHLLILLELALPLVLFHYFYFPQPPYSLVHLQTNISLSWYLFYYMFLRCVIKTTHFILPAYRNYFHQSEVVKCLVAIMPTLFYWFLKLALIIKKKLFQTCQLYFFYKKNQEKWQFSLSNKQSLKTNGWKDDFVSVVCYLSNLTF